MEQGMLFSGGANFATEPANKLIKRAYILYFLYCFNTISLINFAGQFSGCCICFKRSAETF